MIWQWIYNISYTSIVHHFCLESLEGLWYTHMHLLVLAVDVNDKDASFGRIQQRDLAVHIHKRQHHHLHVYEFMTRPSSIFLFGTAITAQQREQ
ncbi:predicted protein [Lichtheimia corymbifera JMRC:FSU:9682]|uniref:Uncharacterized protein n=1 Tax=Lichtheimia corymbifera JMRC:FSU:9682 TaxID=1263082 RepID=A0A068SGE3_9FUNG|nr:predicted protein [Lichtheimia corymbifera JMRC:FSU:9682]